MSINEEELENPFSIKDLENLTGIKAHTLRIWEQRYNLVKPHRTDSNIRTYTYDDLKFILNVSLLNSRGIKISKIANMERDEMLQRVLEVTEPGADFAENMNALTLAMLDLDEDRFEKILSNLILKMGFEDAIIKVIYPFLNRIGILWQTDSIVPAQEHFISNLIRQKFIVALDAQAAKEQVDAKRFVLYLPEGELHELNLLFASYLLRSKGHKVVYLGQNVPKEDLKVVHQVYKPDVFYTVVTIQTDYKRFKDYLFELSGTFPECLILVSGFEFMDKETPENLRILRSMQDMLRFIDHELT